MLPKQARYQLRYTSIYHFAYIVYHGAGGYVKPPKLFLYLDANLYNFIGQFVRFSLTLSGKLVD